MENALLMRASVLATLATVAHAQQVLTVGAGPAPFRTIQAAVDAASPGDTVLIRPGQHAGATVSQSLALIADGPGVEFTSQLLIDSVAADSTVLAHGLNVS